MALDSPRRGMPAQRIALLIGALVVLLIFSKSICSLILDYAGWGEMGQVNTWLRMSAYQDGPPVIAWIILFFVLWIAHARGMKHAGTGLGEHRLYARLSTLGLALLALIIVLPVVDGWTVARFFGGMSTASGYIDPVFGRSLTFYFFELPFYSMLISFVTACAFAAAVVHYVTALGWQMKQQFPGFGNREIDLLAIYAA